MRTFATKFLLLTVPAIGLVLAVIEIWVRASWDPTRGTPGLYLSDPVLVQRFAPNYSGWFAGVPVRINNLGLHDRRDYTIEKGPNTFRVLLLGDSVAFGHGSIEDHTYARLLEQKLKSWRPEIDWQIWNAGVPGYNSSQELALLERVGPRYRPDLVIVGFHPNDIRANDIVRSPGRRARLVSWARNIVKRTLYSYEFYRRLYLHANWRLFESSGSKRLLDNLGAEDELLANRNDQQTLPQQQITPITPLPDDVRASVHCRDNGNAIEEIERYKSEPEYARWHRAIARFHELNRQGSYRIMFFVSTAPDICPQDDLFFDGGARTWNDFFVRELSGGTPVLSTFDAILRYRPSQMPEAKAHALGNVNRLKADLLFDFLRDWVVPGARLTVRR